MTKQKVIFFGNGPLADYALETLKTAGLEIVFVVNFYSAVRTGYQTALLQFV